MPSAPSFLISPNAFKGTIDAERAAELISDALLAKVPNANVTMAPIADGGDGTCYLLGKALDLEQVECLALDALGRPVRGFYFLDRRKQTAYLDISTVSGIKLLRGYERNPWIASTYGTGELIREAMLDGATQIVLGLGGSATIDLGMGILRALGFLFLDKSGREITVFSEGSMQMARHIQAPIPKHSPHFTLLCDVGNFFKGPDGAIPVFGPQKGLAPEDLGAFAEASAHMLQLMSEKSRKDIADSTSFGAAGGIAYGLSFFYSVSVERGAAWFFDKIGLEEKVKSADWVITGEGHYDGQSESGKGTHTLLQLAKSHNKKVALVTSGPENKAYGFDRWIELPHLDFAQAGAAATAEANLSSAFQCLDWG